MNVTETTARRTEAGATTEETPGVYLAVWQKLLLTIAVLGAVLWLGGSVVRTAIAYDMFVPGTLDYKPDMPPMAAAQSLRLFAITSFYTIIGYAAAVVGFVPVYFSLRRRWRFYGWLFIAGLLFVLYIPFEVWQIYFDTRLVRLVEGAGLGFDIAHGKAILLDSFSLDLLGDFGRGARLLSFLGYITAIAVLLWRPLHKRFIETPAR